MNEAVLLRKQRAVGHGFFHEAALRAPGSSAFRWIYDCGGGRETKREVARFLAETKAASVDLLFLSHLHFDHVSGLPRLLDKVGVKRALLPHLTPAERLLIAVRCAAEGSMPVWFARFLADPPGWLRANGADEVIEVIRGEGLAPEPRPAAAAEGEEAPAGVSVTIFHRGQSVAAGTSTITDEAALVASQAGIAVNFLLYLQPATLDQVNAFLTQLGPTRAPLEEAVGTKAGLRALKAAYEAGWRNINWTSLCVAVIPVGARGAGRPSWIQGGDYFFDRFDDRPGWLGLGDAVLREASEVALLRKHLATALPQVGVYSLPHHGSDDNFCEDLLYLCAPADRRTSIVRYATARKGNKKHPSPSVRRTFEEHALRLSVVTDDPASQLTQWLIFRE